MSKRKSPPTSQPQPAHKKGKLLHMPQDHIILQQSSDPIGFLTRITLSPNQTLPSKLEETAADAEERPE